VPRLGFTYEIDRCTGCKACQIACKDRNDLHEGSFFRRVDLVNYEGSLHYYSGACNHCEKPACAEACPTKALYSAEDGTVQHSAGKCIGCGSCVRKCPYGAPKLSESLGISRKCDACAELRALGRTPVCVRACITHCLQFGEVSEDGWIPSFLPNPEATRPALRIVRDTGGAGDG
jgi:anaerobic dimethyl sulfoxide reductase subunit B (iron-sulfur subunit)